METFDQVENKKDFKKIVWIAGGIALLAGLTVLFIFLGRGSRETVKVGEVSPSDLVSPGSSSQEISKPIFSQDVLSWTNYFWPEKTNLKYPSNWKLEEIKEGNIVLGLRIIPATENETDSIFIGGKNINCASASKYSTNKCLKNKIQIPFYTDSQNPEVLAAFDLIFQNAILTEESK